MVTVLTWGLDEGMASLAKMSPFIAQMTELSFLMIIDGAREEHLHIVLLASLPSQFLVR